jgi:hypothetical protein
VFKYWARKSTLPATTSSTANTYLQHYLSATAYVAAKHRALFDPPQKTVIYVDEYTGVKHYENDTYGGMDILFADKRSDLLDPQKTIVFEDKYTGEDDTYDGQDILFKNTKLKFVKTFFHAGLVGHLLSSSALAHFHKYIFNNSKTTKWLDKYVNIPVDIMAKGITFGMSKAIRQEHSLQRRKIEELFSAWLYNPYQIDHKFDIIVATLREVKSISGLNDFESANILARWTSPMCDTFRIYCKSHPSPIVDKVKSVLKNKEWSPFQDHSLVDLGKVFGLHD